MSTLINLLLESGQLLSRAAAKTLQEAFCASVTAREYLAIEYDRLGCVIEDHDSMLGLIQERGPELSRLLGAELDIHVAVIDGAVRSTLESYFKSVKVPFVQVNKSSHRLSKDDQVFLTVSPKNVPSKKIYPNAQKIAAKGYSTQTDDKDLEFLKRQIREKFKKLLQANADKANAMDRKIRDIDISKTLQQMTDTQKFILQDLDSLMRCLKEIDELRSYLKFVGIKDNTIHVVVMGDGEDADAVADRSPPATLEEVKMEDEGFDAKEGDEPPEDADMSASPHGLGDSYAKYLSKFSLRRPPDNMTEEQRCRKRKRDDDGAGDNDTEGKEGILGELAKKIRNKRRKGFCETMLKVGFGGRDGAGKGVADLERSDDAGKKGGKSKEAVERVENPGDVPATAASLRDNVLAVSFPFASRMSTSISDVYKRFDERVSKTKVKKEQAALLLRATHDHLRTPERTLETSGSVRALGNSPPKNAKITAPKDKTKRKFEKRSKHLMRGRDTEKTRKGQQERCGKMERHLQKMKRLEEQVGQDCKLMFANKRQFMRLEKQLNYQMRKEKEREDEENLLLLNQAIFEDVERQVAKKRAIGQLQKEVEFASRLIAENQSAYNTFQRRMLHQLVNNIEPNPASLPSLSCLCGKEAAINDRSAFDMIVEKLQTYDLIDIEDVPPHRRTSEEEEVELSTVVFQPETANVSERNEDLATENIEFLAEIDGLRISIVKLPGEEVSMEGEIEEDRENHYVHKVNEEVNKLHSRIERDTAFNLSEMQHEQKMAAELLEVNEKVFNECEKTLQSVQIIEPKSKFSTNAKEDETGKLLNQPKSKIGDDKRKISTAESLCKKNNESKILQKSKSETNLIADIKKHNLSLYEQIFETTEDTPTPSNLNFEDLLGGQIVPADIEDIFLPDVGCKDTQESKDEGDTGEFDDIAAAIKDINMMLTPKQETLKSQIKKSDSKEQVKEKMAPKRQDEIAQSQRATENKQEKKDEPRKCSKTAATFGRREGTHRMLDKQKLQEDILSRQSAREVPLKRKPSARKQMLCKVVVKERDPNHKRDVTNTRYVSTPDTNKRKAPMKNEASTQNKFVSRNAVPVAIDKDLEKKLIRREMAASKPHPTDYNDDASQKQVKYKSPEKSKYTKIYEQIKARQAEKLQQIKTKKRTTPRSNAVSKSRLSDEAKMACDRADTGGNDPNPNQSEPPNAVKSSSKVGNRRSVADVSSAIEKNKPPNKQLHTTANPSARRGGSEEPRPLGHESKLSLETLYTSPGADTMSLIADVSSCELAEAEDQGPTLITSGNCADLAAPSATCDRSNGLDVGKLLNSRFGIMTTGNLGADPKQKFYRNDGDQGTAADGPRAVRGDNEDCCSDVSAGSTVWKDSYESITDLMKEIKQAEPPGAEREAAAKGADHADVELTNLCIELMDENDIMSLLSTVSSAYAAKSEVKPKEAELTDSSADELHGIECEIASDKFNRRPWGTNVVNLVPSQIRKAEERDILPQTTIWNSQPRQKIAVPPKQKAEHRDKKYRFESKEIVMGNKVTKVTYLVEE